MCNLALSVWGEIRKAKSVLKVTMGEINFGPFCSVPEYVLIFLKNVLMIFY